MPEKKNVKDNKSIRNSTNSLEKQIAEVRNSAIALYNILERKGITNEKEFMDEYKVVSAHKKK